jgi:hypothetical protein
MKTTLHGPLIAAICFSCLSMAGSVVAGTDAPRPVLDVAAIDRGRILSAANAALGLEPITITRFHPKLSEGGSNDFYSNGDYWWPDPTKTNGLPYIQRDGESNPGNFSHHRLALRRMRDAVAALAAADKITGEPRYSAKAAELLRAFFLDEKTRMNPHLKYAQAIPGCTPGRGMRKAMEFLFPYLADKSKWPHKPDLQSWEGWPARQPSLLFAGLALGEQKYLNLWKKLPPDPSDDEVKRNIAITQPLLWLK